MEGLECEGEVGGEAVLCGRPTENGDDSVRSSLHPFHLFGSVGRENQRGCDGDDGDVGVVGGQKRTHHSDV